MTSNSFQLVGRIVSDISFGTFYKNRNDKNKSGRWARFVLLVNTSPTKKDTFLINAFGQAAMKVYKYGYNSGRIIVTGTLRSDRVYDNAVRKDLYVTNIDALDVVIIDYKDNKMNQELENTSIKLKEKVMRKEFPSVYDFTESQYHSSKKDLE